MGIRSALSTTRIPEPTLQRSLALLTFGWIVVVFSIAVLGYQDTAAQGPGRNLFITGISSVPDDQGCVIGTESVGVHCFSDFGSARARGGQQEVYAYHNMDAAAGPLMVIVFEGFRRFTYRAGLAIYMAALMGSVAAVAWWGARRRNVVERSVLYFAGGLASLGALAAFDRGNPVAVIAPLLLAYIVAVERGAWRVAVVSLAVMGALKFWGILLIVVLLAKRKYAAAAQALVLCGLLYIVPLLFLPGGMEDKIRTTLWAVNNRTAADWLIHFDVSPYALLVRIVCAVRGPSAYDPLHPTAVIPGSTAVAVGLSLGFAVWAFMMCRRFDDSPFLAYVPAISLVFLAVPEAFSYNLVATVVMYAVLARWESDAAGRLVGAAGSSDRKLTVWAIVIAMAVATVPIPIILSWSWLSMLPQTSFHFNYVAVPIAWMVAVALSIRLLIRERRASKSERLSPPRDPALVPPKRVNALSHPMVTVGATAEHQYEAQCECGARWRVYRDEDDDDLTATCISCGADTFDLVDIGEPRSAGPGTM